MHRKQFLSFQSESNHIKIFSDGFACIPYALLIEVLESNDKQQFFLEFTEKLHQVWGDALLENIDARIDRLFAKMHQVCVRFQTKANLAFAAFPTSSEVYYVQSGAIAVGYQQGHQLHFLGIAPQKFSTIEKNSLLGSANAEWSLKKLILSQSSCFFLATSSAIAQPDFLNGTISANAKDAAIFAFQQAGHCHSHKNQPRTVRHPAHKLAFYLLLALIAFTVVYSLFFRGDIPSTPEELTNKVNNEIENVQRLIPQEEITITVPEASLIADSAQQEKSLIDLQPQTAWQADIGSEITSSPMTDEQNVYFGAKDFCVYALNKNTGKTVWKTTTKGGVGASPALSSDALFIGSYDKYLYKLDKKTGNELWKQRLNAKIVASPVVWKNYVYIASTTGEVVCFEQKSGKKVWDKRISDAVRSKLTHNDEYLFVTSIDNSCYAFSLENGKQIWRFPSSAAIYSSAVLSPDQKSLCFANKEGVLYFLEVSSGKLQFKIDLQSKVYNSPSFCSKGTAIGTDNGKFYFIQDRSPHLLFTAKDKIWSEPAVYDHFLLIGSYDQQLYIVDLDALNVVDSLQLGPIYAQPFVENNTAYVATTSGQIYKIHFQK